MIITHHGKQFFKLQTGDFVIALNPISKESKFKTNGFGANIALISTDYVDYNGAELVDYAGKKFPQKRVGVLWLTEFKDKNAENILRPKLIQLEEDKFLALYEKWSANTYLTTEYLLFNSSGKILQSPVDLGSARLNRKDDPVLVKGKVIWSGGKKDKGELKVFVLKP